MTTTAPLPPSSATLTIDDGSATVIIHNDAPECVNVATSSLQWKAQTWPQNRDSLIFRLIRPEERRNRTFEEVYLLLKNNAEKKRQKKLQRLPLPNWPENRLTIFSAPNESDAAKKPPKENILLKRVITVQNETEGTNPPITFSLTPTEQSCLLQANTASTRKDVKKSCCALLRSRIAAVVRKIFQAVSIRLHALFSCIITNK